MCLVAEDHKKRLLVPRNQQISRNLIRPTLYPFNHEAKYDKLKLNVVSHNRTVIIRVL